MPLKYGIKWDKVIDPTFYELVKSKKIPEKDVYELAGMYLENPEETSCFIENYNVKIMKNESVRWTPQAKRIRNEEFKNMIQPLIAKEKSGNPCPICYSIMTFIVREQLRAADEGDTAVNYCQSCTNRWFD